jgi:catechol 2,3-dioxygenase-like lactoylglutathione lyase family enzyme
MSEKLQTIAAITMFIDDRERSKAFYEQVFGARAVHEDDVSIAFKFESIVVNLLEVSEAPGLLRPARAFNSRSASKTRTRSARSSQRSASSC